MEIQYDATERIDAGRGGAAAAIAEFEAFMSLNNTAVKALHSNWKQIYNQVELPKNYSMQHKAIQYLVAFVNMRNN